MAKAATEEKTIKELKKLTKKIPRPVPLRKRARNKQGNYIADDPGVSNNKAYKKETSIESYIGIGLALLLIALVVLSS
jgi:hypothetical protein